MGICAVSEGCAGSEYLYLGGFPIWRLVNNGSHNPGDCLDRINNFRRRKLVCLLKCLGEQSLRLISKWLESIVFYNVVRVDNGDGRSLSGLLKNDIAGHPERKCDIHGQSLIGEIWIACAKDDQRFSFDTDLCF